MAEKIITEYDVQTSKAIQNLQGVVNQYEAIETASAKAVVAGSKGINQVAASAAAATPKFNALGNSINQLSRELPAFTNSAQTGFLAISNNLPILADAISQVRAQNEALAASGQKTVPIFKQLASAFFSFNTLISVGITLLTVYGREIGNFISSLFKGTEAFKAAKASLDAINSAYDSKELKSAVRNLVELRGAVNQAREGFVTKESVIKQYNETLGVTFGKVSSIEQAELGIIKNTKAYIDAVVQREAANKVAAEAADTLIKKNKLQAELDRVNKEETVKRNKIFIEQVKQLDERFLRGGIESQEAYNKELAFIIQARNSGFVTTEQKRIDSEIKQLTAQFNSQLNLFETFNTKAGTQGADGAGTIKTAFELLNDEIAKTKLQIQNGVISGSSIQGDLAKLDQLETQLRIIESTIERTRSGNLPGQNKDLPLAGILPPPEQVEQTTKQIKTDLDRLNKKVIDNAKNSIEANKEAGKAWTEYEKEKTKVTEEEEAKRQMLRDMAIQGAFNLASTFESELFALKRNNLRAETEVQVASLQEQLYNKLITEQEFNAQRRQLLNQENQKQRELDLAQIKVETALSIIKTLAQFGFTPAGAIAAALAAAQGATQYAFAASQPLPQFAMGTERVTGGVKGKDSVHALLMPDEAVIRAKENMNRPGLAKAWNAGKLDDFITMQYIQPAIDQVNKRWEREISVNQSNQFIRKDNFNDKNIVGKLDVIARKITQPSKERVRIVKNNNRLWN